MLLFLDFYLFIFIQIQENASVKILNDLVET